MKLNRKWILILSLVLSVAMATGGTLAYLTDTEESVNIMTVGRVDIELIEQQRAEDGTLETFQDDKPLLPLVGSAQDTKDDWGLPVAKNYVDKLVSVKNVGFNDAYVRVMVAIPAALEADPNPNDTSVDQPLHWNFANRFDPEKTGKYNTGSYSESPMWTEYGNVADEYTVNVAGEDFNVYVFNRKSPLAPEQTSAPTISGFYLDSAVDYDHENGHYTFKGIKVDYTDIEVPIPVFAQAVQAGGFNTLDAAFEAAFGDRNAQIALMKGMLEKALGVASISDQGSLDAALAAGADKVYLSADGTYDIPANSDATIVGNGAGTVVKFTGTVKNATLENVRVSADGGEFRLATPAGSDVTFKNVIFDAKLGGWSSINGDVLMDGCTFNNTGIHFDTVKGDITIKNSTFGEKCKVQMGGSDVGALTIVNCTFETSSEDGGIWGTQGMRFYNPTTFVNCAFNNRFVLAGGNGLEIVFDDCTMKGGDPVYYNDNTDGIIRGGNVPNVIIK